MKLRDWLIIGAAFAAFFWYLKKEEGTLESGDGTGGAGGAGGAGDGGDGGDGTGGAGGSGGTGGAGGGLTGLGDVAAALNALAAGVVVPNIQTTTAVVAAGTTELIASESGKRHVVLAYAVTTVDTGGSTFVFWSGSNVKRLWRLTLTPSAGSAGANLAGVWPAHLFATNAGENLAIESAGSGVVSVTYWSE